MIAENFDGMDRDRDGNDAGCGLLVLGRWWCESSEAMVMEMALAFV